MKTRIYCDATIHAIVAAELYRVSSGNPCSITIGGDYQQTEDFFSNEQYVAYDRVLLIGDVSESGLLEDIDTGAYEIPVIGFSEDSSYTFEGGYPWMYHCSNLEQCYDLQPPGYAETMVRFLTDVDHMTDLRDKAQDILHLMSYQSKKQLTMLEALYYAYDLDSFAQLVQDRISVALHGGRFFDSELSVTASTINNYVQNIGQMFMENAQVFSEGRKVVGYTLTATSENCKKFLQHYPEAQEIVVVSIMTTQILYHRVGHDAPGQRFIVNGREYRVEIKPLNLERMLDES